MEEKSLALEMLEELKMQSKRKDKIIIILICVIFFMIVGFFVYESQFEEITTTTDEVQMIEDIEQPTNSNFTQTMN